MFVQVAMASRVFTAPDIVEEGAAALPEFKPKAAAPKHAAKPPVARVVVKAKGGPTSPTTHTPGALKRAHEDTQAAGKPEAQPTAKKAVATPPATVAPPAPLAKPVVAKATAVPQPLGSLVNYADDSSSDDE